MSNPPQLEPEPAPADSPDPYLVLGHLSSTVVHHLINAFSAIVSQAEIMKTLAAPPGLPRAEAATRADAIIRAALDGSTLARGLDEFNKKATAITGDLVDLNQLVRERIAHQQRRGGPNTEWRGDLAPSAELRGAPSHLGLMIDHLLNNAREALPAEGGAVTVSTAVDAAGRLVLEIRDDGPGMTPEVLNQALRPFFSTKPGRPGLGLALARGIWRRHQGAFAIETSPGGGTVVRLSRTASPGGDTPIQGGPGGP